MGVKDVKRAGWRLVEMSCVVLMLMGCASDDVWYEDGKPAGPSSEMKSEGGFGVRHLLTHRPDQLFAEWAKPAEGVPVNTTNKTVRGQVVSSVILFSGCKPDPKGNCDVVADIEIFDPTGGVYGSFENVEVWVNKPPPPKRAIQLSLSDIRMVIEPGEPLGEYRITAKTTDRVGGITVETEQRFEAVESPLAYSSVPLRQPIYSEVELAAQIETYDIWLSENIGSLAKAEFVAAREQLFALIDSVARNRFARDGILYSEEDAEDMRRLFGWAEKLGVFGGSLVVNQLVGADVPQPKTKPPPDSFDLILEGTDFTLTSKLGGWSVSYPYNFMLWTLEDFTPDVASRTQSVSLSTGFARHTSSHENSQATILMFYSVDKDTGWLEREMRAYYGVPSNSIPVEIELPGLTAHKFFNEERNLWVEYLRLDPGDAREGALVVVFLGIDGTYQWNRPHFLDFLRSLTASIQ